VARVVLNAPGPLWGRYGDRLHSTPQYCQRAEGGQAAFDSYMLIVHDPRCAAYGSSLRPEQPARILKTVSYLKGRHPDWEWLNPREVDVSDAVLQLAHSSAHLRRLSQREDFDGDTPALPEIAAHARRAVGAALAAARHAWTHGTPAFSLMRPPGHHATQDKAMGFCYLNQIAVAALAMQEEIGEQGRPAPRIAVWDFDAHHGNGTQAILRRRPGTLFASVHQHPGYPGTGTEDDANCHNWPVPPHAPRAVHMTALRASWDTVVAFKPELVLVSAGFDAYARDPITALSLEHEDFEELGTWLKASPSPVAAILEGGYSEDLPQLIEVFLSAWAE
jgi:acetoin utilization deacetylase AcuC-like enzyme